MIWLLACTGSEPEPVTPPHGPIHPPPPGAHHGPGGPGGPQPEPFFATPDFKLVGGSGEHHNVLIVSLDTVRADALKAWGGPVEGFPGQQVHSRAYSHFPQTCLSHWTLMTGVLPALHGNTPANRGSLYTGPTIAEIANRVGFATGGFIGGQTLMDSQCGLSRGFEVYDDDFVIDPRDMRRHGKEVIGAASSWIQGQEGAWFAFVHLFDAHFPYTPERDRFDTAYTGGINGDDAVLRPYRDGKKTPTPRDIEHVRALYDSEIAEMSEWLQPLWAAAGEDTLILVTADHGESFEHGYWFNHKDSLMEGVLHVPLLLSGPGVEEGTRDTPIGLAQVAPMLLTKAGLPTDTRMGTELLVGMTDPWDPAGTHQWSERAGGQLRIEDPEGSRCYSWPAEQPQDCIGEGNRSAYTSYVKELSAWQTEPPKNAQAMTPDECERLMALGYVDSC